MRAVRIHQHGGPEVVRCEPAPEPKPKANEVLIEVKACALNHLDMWVRGGLPGLTVEMPHTLGSDASGVAVAVGELCGRVKVGDRVLVAPGRSSWQTAECIRGDDHFSRDFGIFGYQYPGVHAELIAIPEVNALPIPGALSFEEAASVPLVFQTASHMLVGMAKIRFCEDVLILGASSGVGIAAVQIAKLFHCNVIATAGGPDKLAKAKALGADHVIDHYEQDIKAEVLRITGKRGVDIVFEHVGKATWAHSTGSLAHHGRLVTCGATTGADVSLDLRRLFARQLTLQGSFMGRMSELWDVLRCFDKGLLKPVVTACIQWPKLARTPIWLRSGSSARWCWSHDGCAAQPFDRSSTAARRTRRWRRRPATGRWSCRGRSRPAPATRPGRCWSICALPVGHPGIQPGPAPQVAALPEGYWPETEAPPLPDSWRRSMAQLRLDRDALKALVASPETDLLAPLPWGDGQDLAREAMLAADHNAYHLGELMTLRRLLGV